MTAHTAEPERGTFSRGISTPEALQELYVTSSHQELSASKLYEPKCVIIQGLDVHKGTMYISLECTKHLHHL